MRLFLLAVLVALGVGLGVTVWPTRYRYEHISVAGFHTLARIDRISGDVETLCPSGEWTRGKKESAPAPAPAPDPEVALPADELAKLRLRLKSWIWASDGNLSGEVFNDSSYVLSSLSLRMTVAQGKDTLSSRELRCEIQVAPGFSQRCSVCQPPGIGIDWRKTTWSLDIASARGHRVPNAAPQTQTGGLPGSLPGMPAGP